MSTNILEVIDLKKHYGDVKAVDGVSFQIKKGTCFGLLGPNGAGKTTTIELIEGILKADSGNILFKGNPRGAEFKSRVGIQFQNTELPQFLSVLETLKTFMGMYPHNADLDHLVNICRLHEIKDRDNRKISGGQKQRLLLAIALANDPELIVLDEPTTGLDPQARRHLWDIVAQIKELGKTVILTTHYMEEAEKLCDEIAIMDLGKIIDLDTTEGLLTKYGDMSTVIIQGNIPESTLNNITCKWFKKDDAVEIQTNELNQCIQALASTGADLSGLTVRTPNLEDVFLNLTGHSLRT